MKNKLFRTAVVLLCLLTVFTAGCGKMTDADRVREMLEALPAPEELPGLSLELQNQAYLDTQAAYEAYRALTDEERAELTEAEAVFDGLFTFFNAQIMPLELE